MDFDLSWSALTGKPTSAVADIDEAVAQRHEHSNKATLDQIGADGSNVGGLQAASTGYAGVSYPVFTRPFIGGGGAGAGYAYYTSASGNQCSATSQAGGRACAIVEVIY